MKRISKEPDVRRQELMDIGFGLYLEGGIKGFSIKDVVNRAGVATGLFYYYFKSKEAFVDEILNDSILNNMEEIQQILDADQLTVMQKITASLEVYWTFVEKLAPYKNENVFQTEQHFQLEQKIFIQMQPPLQKLIEEGVSMGVFNTEHPILAAEFILYGLSSIAHSKKVALNDDNKKEIINLVLTILKYNQEEDI